MFLARVRCRRSAGRRATARPSRPAGARSDGAELHADVGFGLGTLLEPLPWGPGEEHEQAGWRYRVVERRRRARPADGTTGALDRPLRLPAAARADDRRGDRQLVGLHQPAITLRHRDPGAAARRRPRTALSDRDGLELTVTRPRARRARLAPASCPRCSPARFGLEGFAVGEDGRLCRAPQSRPAGSTGAEGAARSDHALGAAAWSRRSR